MKAFIFLTLAFIGNCYLIYISLNSTKRRNREYMDLKISQEIKKYFDNMMFGFGMHHDYTAEEFKKIKSHSDLVEQNKRMEQIIKNYKL
jgi:hypothetical protein